MQSLERCPLTCADSWFIDIDLSLEKGETINVDGRGKVCPAYTLTCFDGVKSSPE